MDSFSDELNSSVPYCERYCIELFTVLYSGLYPMLHFPCLGIDGSAKYCQELLTGLCDHIIHAQLQGLDNHKAGEQRRAMLDIGFLSRVSSVYKPREERC
jgi:hypothetical protein